MSSLKWQVGEVEIFQVLEVNNVGPAIQVAIPMATPENIKKISWLFPYFANEAGILKSSNQSFVIKTPQSIIVVDTADGEGKIRSDLPEWSDFHTNFLNNFDTTGVMKEAVNFVVSTHLHTDHEGFNTLLESGKFVATFPNAKYLFTKDEFAYWGLKPEKEMAADKEAFDDCVVPIMDAGLGQIVKQNHRIDDFVCLRPTPGHTPGHVAVVIESNGMKAILSGDIIHHPCQIAHPEWKMLADVDSDLALRTRQNLLVEIQDTNTLLFSTHFANPVAGKVIRSEGAFIFMI